MATISMQLKQAIALAKAGQKEQARSLVLATVEEEPENANAWLLLSTLAETQEEQVQSLNRVLAIDPDHDVARKRLSNIAPILPEEEPEEEERPAEEGMSAQTEGTVDVEVAEPAPTVIAPFTPEAEAGEPDPALPEIETAETEGEAMPEEVAEAEPQVDAEPLIAVGPEDEEGLATVISSADRLDELEEEPAEEESVAPEEDLPETVVSASPPEAKPAVRGKKKNETGIEETLEMADEELEGLVSIGEPSGELPDLDDIPEWLREEGGYAEPGTETRLTRALDEEPEEPALEQIPHWLKEEPVEVPLEESDAGAVAEQAPVEVEVEPEPGPVADTDLVGEAESEGEAAGQRRFVSTRTLEIILSLLIILALLVVAALAYVVVTMG